MKTMLKLKMRLRSLLSGLKKMFSFIKTKFIGLWNLIPAYLNKLLMLNMYVDCYSLPVTNYIDIISLNDISKFKRTFFPVTRYCFMVANDKVREHIIELSKNTKVKVLNTLSNQLEILREKHSVLFLIGLILEKKESEICLLKLKELGYEAKDRDSGLKRTISALKNLSVNIKLLEKEYDEKKEEKSENKATTRAEFIAQKQILNKNGYPITDKSSTADYIVSIGLISDEIKKLENKTK